MNENGGCVFLREETLVRRNAVADTLAARSRRVASGRRRAAAGRRSVPSPPRRWAAEARGFIVGEELWGARPAEPGPRVPSGLAAPGPVTGASRRGRPAAEASRGARERDRFCARPGHLCLPSRFPAGPQLPLQVAEGHGPQVPAEPEVREEVDQGCRRPARLRRRGQLGAYRLRFLRPPPVRKRTGAGRRPAA